MAYNALECGVCNNGYSEDYIPRILPCSHTLCGLCIDGIISSRRKECPFCRKKFEANSAKDLMFIRSLLDAANQFSAMAIGSETSYGAKTSPEKNSTNDFRKRFTEKGITNCLEAPAQVIDSLETLSEMKQHILENNDDIDSLFQMLPKLKSFNGTLLSSIERNSKMLENYMDLMLEESGDLQIWDARLKGATNFSYANFSQDEGIYQRAVEKVMAIQKFLQKNQWGKVDLPEKYVEMKTMLESVVDEVTKTINEEPQYISVNALRSICYSTTEIQRNIYAVKETKGTKRVAPITIMSENKLLMGHMEERDIPLNSLVMQVKPLLRMTPRRAYLDLGVHGTYLGRIVIQVKDEGNKAKNFLHMCAGDLGPSYINTPLLCVTRKGKNGECVTAGEYEDRGEMVSEAVMPGVDWERERERDIYVDTHVVAGHVRGPITSHEAAEFDIYTRGSPFWRDENHFGDVLEGLDVLMNAIRDYPNIGCVKIMDCGLIFTI